MKFHEWFNAETEKASATDCGKAFISLGFELWHTGGYLTAWRKAAGTRETLASCADSGIPSDESWVIGVYVIETGEIIGESEFEDWESVINVIKSAES